MRRVASRTGTAAVLTVLGLTLAACSGGGTAGAGSTGTADAPKPSVDTTAPVTISVGDLPTTENAAARQGVLDSIKSFQDANPNITVKAEETVWAADTFQALLAGGTMPTVMSVPFTDIGSLMQNKQVADITAYVKDDAVLSDLNPTLSKLVTDQDHHVRGVPINAYTMGLIYNRALFTQAGLDPNNPPKTWDEVRTDAKAIQDKTGVQGFGAMTSGNTGGWVLTAMTYAFGGKIVGDDPTKAQVNNPATKQALEFYKSVRWDDNAFGSNFLVNYGDANKAFAAGKVGMFVQGADIYSNAVVNLGMKPQDVGIAPMPQDSDGLGSLGGGSAAVINPKATPEQITAALKWIDYQYFKKYSSQDVAVTKAKASIANKGVVGAPELRLVGADKYDQWLGWVKDEINVPRDNFKVYLSNVDKLTIVPEPARNAQEVYAALDPVVQAVLTRQDANIDQLLSNAQTSVQSALDSAK